MSSKELRIRKTHEEFSRRYQLIEDTHAYELRVMLIVAATLIALINAF